MSTSHFSTRSNLRRRAVAPWPLALIFAAVAPSMVAAEPGHRRRAETASYRLEALELCDSMFWNQEARDACVRATRRAARYTPAAMRACSANFWGADQSTCVAIVGNGSVFASEVQACDDALYSNRGKLRCLRAVSRSRFGLATTIAACKALYSDEGIASCVELAAQYDGPIPDYVTACYEEHYTVDATLQCLRRGL